MQDIFKSKSSKGLGLSVMEREERGTAILFNPVNYNVTLLRLSKRAAGESRRIPRAPLRGRGVRERRGLLSDFIPESSAGAIKRARDTS